MRSLELHNESGVKPAIRTASKSAKETADESSKGG